MMVNNNACAHADADVDADGHVDSVQRQLQTDLNFANEALFAAALPTDLHTCLLQLCMKGLEDANHK